MIKNYLNIALRNLWKERTGQSSGFPALGIM